MQLAPIPKNEKERLISLHKLGLLDTKPEERFDRITRTATKVFNVSISTLTLVDEKREWFKSVCGLDQKEGDRAISFCGHALLTNEIFVIPDTKKDTRFSDNPMVIGKPYIRFYAGVPIMNADGQRIGVFCVKDKKPRKFSKENEELLKNLSSWAELEINSRNLSFALSSGRETQAELETKTHELENEKIAVQNVYEDLQIEKEALANAKAKDEALLESIGDGVIATDPDKRIIVMNKKAEELLGWKINEAIGKLYDDIILLEDEKGTFVPDKEKPLHKAFESRTTTTTTTTTVLYLLSKNKIKFPVAITVSPIILDNKTIGAVEVFRDITKEKEIDKAKTEFVSLASHQLRTPLTGIEWIIELFSKKEKLTAEGKQYLNDIHFSASRLSALVRLLLNVSRIESGNVGVSPESLELVGLVNQCMRESQSLNDKKKLSFVFAEHPEKLNATTDKNLLGFILQNIIANAIDYTLPPGKIEIVLEKKGEAALFTVKDTGIGIPKKEQARIFEKFVRASNAISIKPDGTGLGLYIVLESVKLLGGKIWFESDEGRGSVFFVELPLIAQPHAGEKGVILLNQKDKV